VTRGDGSGTTLGVTLRGSLRFTGDLPEGRAGQNRRCSTSASRPAPIFGTGISLGIFSVPSQLVTRLEPHDQGLGC
jgi:hypothetical protein